MRFFIRIVSVLSIAVAIGCGIVSSSTKTADLKEFTSPPEIESDSTPKGIQTAVFAGGCFWGVEAVFEHVKGVTEVKSGYAGGTKGTADYDTVSDGKTTHAEAVEIRFDSAKISYEKLLYVFFTVVHDPTELNRQGPDVGPQYRSAIFYKDETQKKSATAFIDAITASKVYSKPVVTQVVPFAAFYVAEEYHQDYMKKNPTDAYIVYHDKPKVEALKKNFPELYIE